MTELFREEAIQSRHRRLLGDVSLAVPLSAWAVWMVIVGLFAGVLIFAIVASFDRKETVVGWLRPSGSTVQVRSQGDWIIRNVLVREGQKVQVNQPLLQASVAGGPETDDQLIRGGYHAIDAELADLNRRESALIRMNDAQAVSEAAEIASGKAQIKYLNENIQAQSERITLARNSLELLAREIHRGFVSKVEFGRRKDQVLSTEQALAELIERRAAIQARLVSTEMAPAHRQSTMIAAQAEISAKRSELRQKRMQLRSRGLFTIRSPIDGTVSSILVHPGETISRGNLQLNLAPISSNLVAEVFVPSRSIGFVRVGQQVRIELDAFSSSQYGFEEGTIARVSTVALKPADAPGGLKIQEPVYPVLVSISPRTALRSIPFRLRNGMMLRAFIVLDRTPVWRAFLRPLLRHVK